MNISNRGARVLIGAANLVLAIAILASGVTGQNGNWQVTRADYGFRNQRSDVTNLIQALLSRGGVAGRIAVNNQTMGGDPAPGADKVLRIFAVDNNNQQREFDYSEGAFVPTQTFVTPRDDGDNRDGFHGGPDRGDRRALSITRGYYGAQGRMVNVTDLLQKMVRGGTLTVPASNGAMGIDPAPGADKILIVIYQYRGQEQAAAASEGHTLSIP